jgi:hypothetical protein
MIRNFEDLPNYLQIYLKKRLDRKGYDYKAHVHKKISELDEKSIIEVMNEPGGEEKIINMFNEFTGLYGGPYILKKPDKNA